MNQLDMFAPATPPPPPPKPGLTPCARDPERGPGTCWLWWDGCPKAKKRGCLARRRSEVTDA